MNKIFFQINNSEAKEVMEVSDETPFHLLTINEFPTQRQLNELRNPDNKIMLFSDLVTPTDNVNHYLFMFTDGDGNQFKIFSKPL